MISPTCGVSKRKCTQSKPISPMWLVGYSLSYLMVLEWSTVFPFREMWSGGGCQQWPVVKTTSKWTVRRSKRSCIEWPRSTTFWRSARVAKTYELHRINLALRIHKWQPWDTFQILKKISMHPGQTLNMMVWLHLNCRKDHLRHQLCLQSTSLEKQHKYWISTESNKSTAILPNVMRKVNQKAFQTPKFGLTGMQTWLNQVTAKTIRRQATNQI